LKTEYALITEATSGTGLCHARELVARGYCIAAVSNEYDRLLSLADTLAHDCGVTVRTICTDLANPDAAEEVYKTCRSWGITVEVLVNNVCAFVVEPFEGLSAEAREEIVRLRVAAAETLCRLFGEEMCNAGKGYILNTLSPPTSTSEPNVYSAARDFLRTFTEPLRRDFRGHGVSVTISCPPLTALRQHDTQSHRTRRLARLRLSSTPEELARKGVEAMFSGRREVFFGGILRR